MGFHNLSFVGILSHSASNGIPTLIFRWNLVPISFQWDSTLIFRWNLVPICFQMGFHIFFGILSQSVPNGIPQQSFVGILSLRFLLINFFFLRFESWCI